MAVRHDTSVEPIPDGGRTWIEVKSVTLHRGANNLGAFPDAVSERALKHVRALQTRINAGDRGVLIFCAQHCGIESVEIAADIDPAYAEGVKQAIQAGLEVYAFGCSTDLQTMQITEELALLPP